MPENSIKVSMLGAPASGKTNLLKALQNKPFASYESTIGTDYADLNFSDVDGTPTFSFCEISGSDAYKRLWNLYLKGRDIVILNFSYDDKGSLGFLTSCLEVANQHSPGAQFVVVGSKAKIAQEKNVISDDEVKQFLLANKANLGAYPQFVKVDVASRIDSINPTEINFFGRSSLQQALERCHKQRQLNTQAIHTTGFFPKSYGSLSCVRQKNNQESLDDLKKLQQQMLHILKDYSGYRPFLGIFSKAGFFHRGRHHRQAVVDIINQQAFFNAEQLDSSQLVQAYNALACINKKPGGSLDRRVQYIQSLIIDSNVDVWLSDIIPQQYNNHEQLVHYTAIN